MTTSPTVAPSATTETRTIRKLRTHIIPFVFVRCTHGINSMPAEES
jgi:hypothetical protein